MGTTSRVTRRVRRLLADDEIVLTTLGGVEEGGRRRRTVVVTDRRAVVTSTRPEAPLELELEGLTGRFVPATGTLTLHTGDDAEVALRDVDAIAARALLDLLAHHRSAPDVRETRQHRIRLVSGLE
jgi:hypothetical protein